MCPLQKKMKKNPFRFLISQKTGIHFAKQYTIGPVLEMPIFLQLSI